MTINEIANKIAELNRTHSYQEIYENYYSPDVISVEAMDGPMKEVRGMEQIMQKMQWWQDNNETHSVEVSEPLVSDSHFAITFKMDTTDKSSGNRTVMTELGLYEVKNGKVVREEFFYSVN